MNQTPPSKRKGMPVIYPELMTFLDEVHAKLEAVDPHSDVGPPVSPPAPVSEGESGGPSFIAPVDLPHWNPRIIRTNAEYRAYAKEHGGLPRNPPWDLDKPRPLAVIPLVPVDPVSSSEGDARKLEEIRDTIWQMQRRLEQGQGQRHEPMCRLSLSMSKELLRIMDSALVRHAQELREARDFRLASGVALGVYHDADGVGSAPADDQSVVQAALNRMSELGEAREENAQWRRYMSEVLESKNEMAPAAASAMVTFIKEVSKQDEAKKAARIAELETQLESETQKRAEIEARLSDYDFKDSDRLASLRGVIDEVGLWESEEAENGGDYEACVRHMAGEVAEWKRLCGIEREAREKADERLRRTLNADPTLARIAELEAENAKLRERVGELEEKLQDQARKMRDAADCGDDPVNFDAHLEELVLDRDNFKQRATQAEAERDTANQNNERAQTIVKELRGTQEALEKKLDTAQAEAKRLREELESLQEQHAWDYSPAMAEEAIKQNADRAEKAEAEARRLGEIANRLRAVCLEIRNAYKADQTSRMTQAIRRLRMMPELDAPLVAFPAPAEGNNMSDEERGLYGKYIVHRTDGSSGSGGKHEHCEYFVLDLIHDEHAHPALQAYALSCRRDYPELSNDLVKKLVEMDERRIAGPIHIEEPAEPTETGDEMEER